MFPRSGCDLLLHLLIVIFNVSNLQPVTVGEMTTLPSGGVTVAGVVGGDLAEEEDIALFLPAGEKRIRTNRKSS